MQEIIIKKTMGKNLINVALFGLGRIGLMHANNLINNKNFNYKIKKIEKKLGRTKSKRNHPRVCDIDIIDYNGEIIYRKHGNHTLNIPHKRMHNRNFVLFPLYELDKDWVHPKLNKKDLDYIYKKISDFLN